MKRTRCVSLLFCYIVIRSTWIEIFLGTSDGLGISGKLSRFINKIQILKNIKIYKMRTINNMKMSRAIASPQLIE